MKSKNNRVPACLIPFLQTQLSKNSSIQENIDTTYSNFDSVENLILETIDSLSEFELSDMKLIKQLNSLISELKLNLEELWTLKELVPSVP